MTAAARWMEKISSLPAGKLFWLLLGISLIPRLLLLVAINGEGFHADARWYLSEADKILSGDPFDPYWPPALPHFLAGWVALFGKSELGIRLAMLLVWAGFFRLFFLLAKKCAGLTGAFLGGLFVALFPILIHPSVEPLSQLPAATCLLGLLWFAWQGKAMPAGLFMGLLVLLRPSALLLLPFVLLFFWRKYPEHRSKAIVLAGTALLLIGGWEVRAHQICGRWVAINDANARNFYLGNNAHTPLYKTWYLGSHWAGQPDISPDFREELASMDALPAQKRNAAFRSAALQHIAAQPGLFALRSLSRICTFFAFDSFTGSFLLRNYGFAPLIAYGVIAWDALFFISLMLALLWVIFQKRAPFRHPELLLGALLYATPYFFSFSHPSFHLPVLPVLLLFVLSEGVKLKFPPLRPLSWGLLLTLAIFAYIQVEWIIQMW